MEIKGLFCGLGNGPLYRDTWAEVNLDAIAFNVHQTRQRVGPKVKIMAVVKADAYGHGALPVAMTALAAGADALGVATLDEALALRRGGVDAPVLVLGYVAPPHADKAADEHITITIVSAAHAKALSQVDLHRPVEAHLKIDTGMGRLGVRSMDEMEETLKILAGSSVRLTGAFTHFAQADARDKSHARGQLSQAKAYFERLRELWPGPDRPVFHAANSAAVIDLPDTYLDMVRLGISLYGVYPSEDVNMNGFPLQQALRLYTRIAYLKTVPPGTSISYGSTHVTQRETKVATLPIGYGDGLFRNLSNRGYVFVRGVRCPILGRVCMDQVMVDVTSVPGVKEGDLVTVYDERTLYDFARLLDTIPYELLCAVSKRVPRVYVSGGRIVGVRNLVSDS
ncbi:MAG: alanine racemase [Alicyclobacillaceae bacterium]|nr:alanine racemase [Alicyclobacillaceae bacterium]